MSLVECVPNISEGRDRAVIDRCAAAISRNEGVELLDVDPGSDTNRTVLTFVGDPDSVLAACHSLFEAALGSIDMSRHQGTHARQAAVDVCPFIPVSGIEMKDCVALAHRFGEELGALGYSGYFYEEAANRRDRQNLADIRRGEYETLETKLRNPAWVPDFGPAEFTERVRRFGAPVIGAREFLIAWNINVNTSSKKLAHLVALDIRERGRAKRDEQGALAYADGGGLEFEPVETSLPTVKSVGWVIDTEAYGPVAQVSINLCNYKTTPMWKVYERTREVAQSRGIVVTGAEIVGLVPKSALLECGRYYRERLGVLVGVSDDDLLRTAVQSMGLSDLYPFDIEKKVIENRIEKAGRLVSLSVRDFCSETASESPAPGGGSIAALAGALSASLSAMVTQLTHGKKEFKDVTAEMNDVGMRAHRAKDFFLRAVDEDTIAFNAVMTAMRLPRETEEQVRARNQALESANQNAARIPLQVARACLELIELAEIVIDKGNPNSMTDGGTAASMAQAACLSAGYNVLTNLSSVGDPAFVTSSREEISRILESADEAAVRVRRAVMQRLGRA